MLKSVELVRWELFRLQFGLFGNGRTTPAGHVVPQSPGNVAHRLRTVWGWIHQTHENRIQLPSTEGICQRNLCAERYFCRYVIFSGATPRLSGHLIRSQKWSHYKVWNKQVGVVSRSVRA